jgi:hypothetical protein
VLIDPSAGDPLVVALVVGLGMAAAVAGWSALYGP